ncbi:M16 family metallopeptidase, partial [Steroidobacter sp.]|uniref:M16 family metallopeptidase n=1 Tax=Steroidobacter sp. TaxID=1978227 RepID=UPI001A604A4A
KARHLGLLANATSHAISAADWFGPQLLFGPNHPYGRLQNSGSIAAVSRADIQRFHRSRMRPDHATLAVVGDIALPQLKAQLESLLASWQAGGDALGAAPASVARTTKSTLWLIDAPGASQSSVQLLLPAPAHAREREPALQLLTRLMGQSMNRNLRTDKNWSYGVVSTLSNQVGARSWRLQSLVQTDKTAPALVEMRRELDRLASDPSVVAESLLGIQQVTVRELPDSWETHQEVAAALGQIALHRLPDDYLLSYSRRIESVTPLEVSRLAAELLANRGETWIVAGDLAKIRAELDALGIGEAKVIEAARGPSL